MTRAQAQRAAAALLFVIGILTPVGAVAQVQSASPYTGFTSGVACSPNGALSYNGNSFVVCTSGVWAIENIDLVGQSIMTEIANAGTTGTAVNELAKLTGAPSTAVVTAGGETGGVIGIVVGNAGTTGNAQIAIGGQASCVFDGATTAGHYVQISSTAGDCHDTGSSIYPSSGQVLGRVLSTHGSGGTYAMEVFGPDMEAASSSVTVNSATQYQMAYYSSSTAIAGDANVTTDSSNDFIISSGKLVIGTATVGNAITLSGQNAQTINMAQETTASTAGNNLTLQAGGGYAGNNLNGGTLVLSSGIATGTGSSGISFQTYNAGPVTSSNNYATTALTMTAIGTSGSSKAGGTGTSYGTTLQGISAVGLGTDYNGGNLTLASGISTGTGSSGINFNIYGAAGSSGNSANSATTAMTIASDGFVGIGSSTPQGALDVDSSVTGTYNVNVANFHGSALYQQGIAVNIDNDAASSGNDQTVINFGGTPDSIYWGIGNSYNNNTTNDFFIVAFGQSPIVDIIGNDVGIGTTSAASTLSVNGGAAIGSYAGTTAISSGNLAVSGTVGIGTNALGTNAVLAVSGGAALGTYGGNKTTVISNGIAVSGNVGIGTAKVSGTSVNLAVNGGEIIGSYASSNSAGTSNGLVVSGNVGVGTSNPGGVFTVGNNACEISSTGILTLCTWNGAAIGAAYGGTGTGTAFTQGSVIFAGASGVYSQDNAKFFWNDTSHSLGIGTATASGANVNLAVNGGEIIGSYASSNSAGTSNGLVVSGNVGVGTSNPGGVFTVGNNACEISSTGILTLCTWNGAAIGAAYGGTGTGTAFTQGSVIFAGASGVYSQDNAKFFWNDTSHSLGIGTATASGANVNLAVNGGEIIGSYAGSNSAGISNGLAVSGNVGIGTATVSGSNVNLAVNGGLAVGSYANTNSAGISNGIVVSGNVGIGTATVSGSNVNLAVNGGLAVGSYNFQVASDSTTTINSPNTIAALSVTATSTSGEYAGYFVADGTSVPIAVYGIAGGTRGYGVSGYASNGGGYGVYGYGSSTSYGVWGESGTGYGVYCAGSTCGGSATWTSSSDARLKRSVADLPDQDGLSAIMKLRPVTFHWKDKKKNDRFGERLGFIAQEIEKVFPQTVITGGDTTIDYGNGKKETIKDTKTLGYAELTVPLVKAVQELKAENDNLAAEHAADANAIDELRREIADLERTIAGH